MAALAATGNNPSEATCRFERDVDYNKGQQGHTTGVKSEQDCCALCATEPGCTTATYLSKSQLCWYKTGALTGLTSSVAKGAVSCVLLRHLPLLKCI